LAATSKVTRSGTEERVTGSRGGKKWEEKKMAMSLRWKTIFKGKVLSLLTYETTVARRVQMEEEEIYAFEEILGGGGGRSKLGTRSF